MRPWALTIWMALGCTCPPGQAACREGCVDVESSVEHCGGCELRCDGICEAGVCRRDGCLADADCDDGRGCNGRERCVERTCRRVEPVIDCDDGLACTVDQCVEPGSCTHEPDDLRCPRGGTCDGPAPSGCTVVCDAEPCDLYSQCGCLRSQACYENLGEALCAAEGPGAEGAPCERDGDCGAGLGCRETSIAPTLVSSKRCGRYCRDDSDCTPSRELCFRDRAGAVGICHRQCNLLEPSCGGAQQCTLALGVSENVAVCRLAPGTLGMGERCSSGIDCLPDHICVRTTDITVCAALCVTDRDCRTGARRCVGLVEPLVVDGTTYGACT